MLTGSMDIETLSVKKNSVVLSFGFCLFDDEKVQPIEEIIENGVEIFFEVECQKEKGHDVLPSTLQWWEKQGAEAQRVLHATDTIHPREFYASFGTWCESNGHNMAFIQQKLRWFTRGPHFDIAIMESLFESFNVTPPWKYWSIRDIRTWLECNGMPNNQKLVKPDVMIPHNALHDAAFDAWMMQQVKAGIPLEIDESTRR